ncbi:MAG: SRPBCC family protein [Flavobacteriaceae bacterium]|nr:SRPBCC family protein [Flavobacteriaceae bacterium]
MKILKYLLLLLLVIVGGFLLFTTLQPNNYDVKRSKLIEAPVSAVYNNVNDYKNWKTWGPWYDDDPTIKETYADQTSGVGGAYSWTSKDGPGNMQTISLEENKSISQKLQFSDYEPGDTYWTFEETEGGTNVTWGMKADKIPFMFKFFGALSGGMDNMLGPMLEKGLDKMANVMPEYMKNNPPAPPKETFTLGSILSLKQDAQQFIGYKQVCKIDHEAITKLFMEFMPKAGIHAAAQKLADTDYTPASVFTKWDEEKGEAEFYIGLIVRKDIALDKGMEKVTLPDGKNIMITKYGPYGTGDQEAHMAIDQYLKENGLEQNGAIWELYLNDPMLVKPEDVETEIHYPVK